MHTIKSLAFGFAISFLSFGVLAQSTEDTTPYWGDYTTMSAGENEALIGYSNVFNLFKVTANGDNWTVSILNQGKECASVKYFHNSESKKLLLRAKPTLNSFLFDPSIVTFQKNNGKIILDEKEIIKEIGVLIHDLFKEKYKSFVGTNDKVVFFQSGNVYVGPISNKMLNGRGILYLENETHRGRWIDNKKHGNFDITSQTAIIKAYYEHGKKEGTWKVNYEDGGISEMVFENDEKVGTNVVKASPKKELNKKIDEAFSQFVFELGTPESLKNFIAERAKGVQGLDEKILLADMQLKVKPIKYKIDGKIAGMQAASNQLTVMLDEATAVGCAKSADHIKKMQKELNKMWDSYNDAYHEFNEQEFTTTKETFQKHLDTGFDHLSKANASYNRLVPLVNSLNKYPCTNTEIVNSKSKRKKTKVYSAGFRVEHNKTITTLTITSVEEGSAAEKAGVNKGDKLLRIDGQFVGDFLGSVANEWLSTTDPTKIFEIQYHDVSANLKVTVNITPAVNKYDIVKTEKFEDYIENSTWGDKKYTGQLKMGIPHGRGKIIYSDGHVYEGEIDQGELTGQGKMTYKNGAVYAGGWFKGKKHGKSVYTTSKGVVHHGKYSHGKKSGTFYVVHSDDRIIQQLYDSKGKISLTKQVTLEYASKYLGHASEKEKPKPTTSTAMKPKVAEEDQVGVGIVIGYFGKGRCYISNTLSGYAAKKVGIREGMQILEVDGRDIKDLSKSGVKRMLKGTAGSNIVVKCCPRNKPDQATTYELTRGKNGRGKVEKADQIKKETSTKTSTFRPSADLVGIGISYMKGKDSEIFEITGLLSKTPAYKAGVRRFDNLLKVDDIEISSKSRDEVRAMILGKKGTSVKLTIERDGEIMEFEVVRN